MNVANAFAAATGGYPTVPGDWVSATALRPLLQDDPCLVWLRYHGANHGFEKDVGEHSFLDWISEVAGQFEDEWVRRMAPEAVRANERDTDVTDAAAVRRTLELMARPDVRVIAKAALWLAEIGAYGTMDLLARASWLRETFPRLRACLKGERDHWVVLDAKFMSGLDTIPKKEALRLASAQVRLYSYIVGRLQGVMPSHALLVTRDRVADPLPVEVEHEPDGPLDPFLADLIAECRHIKRFGGRYTPWTCPIVTPNWRNKKDAPWSGAKRRILEEHWPHTPLEVLPGIGHVQAAALRGLGFASIEELLARDPDGSKWAGNIPRFGPLRESHLRAILTANATGRPTPIPAEAVPRARRTELYCDFEFLSSCHPDFDRDWPELKGREMVFMIGVGWEEAGGWRFRRFTARDESAAAEQVMWRQFLSFLRKRGVGIGRGAGDDAVLFHWSPAERVQARRASERLDLPELEELPWLDLRESFTRGQIALPGHWSYGLKEVARAVGDWSSDHAVAYPDGLGEGLSAMVAGWRAYEQAEPRSSREMKLIGCYLEVDCRSLKAVLDWLRYEAASHGEWKASHRSARCRRVRQNPLILPVNGQLLQQSVTFAPFVNEVGGRLTGQPQGNAEPICQNMPFAAENAALETLCTHRI